MCGSDIPFFTGSKRHGTYPLSVAAPIPESVRQVVESMSSLFQPGDRFVSISESDQGLSEFFVARAAKAVKPPPELGDDSVSFLIQSLSTVINAVDRLGDVGRKICLCSISRGFFDIH
jgi:threonine dehydrogenase-like Zn-dependent dehydrogenase